MILIMMESKFDFAKHIRSQKHKEFDAQFDLVRRIDQFKIEKNLIIYQ